MVVTLGGSFPVFRHCADGLRHVRDSGVSGTSAVSRRRTRQASSSASVSSARATSSVFRRRSSFMSCSSCCMWILHRTKYGERLFLIGVNPQAAEYSGINTRATIMSTYVLSAVSAAIAGTLLTANVNSAKYDLGSGYTLAIITAVVLGGTLNTGGKGQHHRHGARVADYLHPALRPAALLRREHAEPRSADRPDSGCGRSGTRNRRSAHAFSPVQKEERLNVTHFRGRRRAPLEINKT